MSTCARAQAPHERGTETTHRVISSNDGASGTSRLPRAREAIFFREQAWERSLRQRNPRPELRIPMMSAGVAGRPLVGGDLSITGCTGQAVIDVFDRCLVA